MYLDEKRLEFHENGDKKCHAAPLKVNANCSSVQGNRSIDVVLVSECFERIKRRLISLVTGMESTITRTAFVRVDHKKQSMDGCLDWELGRGGLGVGEGALSRNLFQAR